MTTPAQPSIPAQHNRLAEELIYRLLVQRPTRATFDRVWLKIEGPLPQPDQGPLICYLNHPSWWDGYVALMLHRELFRRRFENYLMMDERQLRSYRFFSWIGVFSVDLHKPGRADASIDYITQLLRERRDRCFWIFPQGRLTANDARPLRIYPGVARVAQRTGALLWPVAVRYEFRNEQRPELFIRCGPAHRAAAGEREGPLTRDIRQRLTATADALRSEVIEERLDDYAVLLRGRPGINRVFDAARNLLPWRRGDPT